MARPSPLLRGLVLVAGGIAGVLMLLVVFFTQTPWGRELVLAEVLRRVESGIAGTLEVEGISSSGLLRGFTLQGVRLAGEDGRPFLAADSIRGAPSASALLRGDLVFSRVMVWRPRITVEKLARESQWNVLSIFFPRGQGGEGVAEAASAPRPDTAEASGHADPASVPDSTETPGEPGGRTILLRGFGIENGSLNVLFPATAPFSPGDRGLYVRDDRGRRVLRRLTFTQIDLDLGSADLASPRRAGQRFDIESLAMRGEVWEDPFFIEDLVGTLAVEGPSLTLAMEALDLPASELQGDLEVDWSGPRGVVTRAGGSAASLSLADLHWLEPRLPLGTATGPFSLALDGNGVTLFFEETRAESEYGRVRATGAVTLGGRMGFEELALGLDELDLDLLTPWVPDTLPLAGWVTGNLSLDGGLDTLSVNSDVTFLTPDSTGQAVVRATGLLHLDEALGATGLSVTVAPMDWRAVRGVAPASTLRGPGSLRIEATGLLDEGLRVSTQATYTPGDQAPSRVTADGIIRRDSTEVFLELVGELRPLSLTALRSDLPDLPVTGELDGSVDLRGPLRDLNLSAQLATSAGSLTVDARFDARNPTQDYTLTAGTPGLTLSGLLPNLPEPTVLAGRLLASGRGISRNSLSGEATAFVQEGGVGSVVVDTATAVLRVEAGVLHVDALSADTDLGSVSADGTFGFATDAGPGELRLQFESESLSGLQPFLFGELTIARDTLDAFARGLLELEGVDIDTLPTMDEVRIDGAFRGQAILRGGLEEFAGEGRLDFQDVYFRSDYVARGRATFSAEHLPGPDRRVGASVETDSLSFRTFSFRSGQADLDLGAADGRVQLTLARSPGEEYRARGTFALDSLGGGSVDLDELTLLFDTLRWNLGGPAGFAWSDDGVDVRDFRLIRPGPSGMRIEADGFFPLAGEADLEVQLAGVNVATLARVAQLERSLEGVVDVGIRLTGTAAAPKATATIQGEGLRFDELRLARLNSELDYADNRIQGQVLASEERGAILEARGGFPADLRWRAVEDRFPEAPVDVAVSLDSFPAALALAWISTLEEVRGNFTGNVRIGGTPGDLAPSGEIRLAGGSALLPALGVRYEQVEAGFEVLPDASVSVDGLLRSRGTARVLGTVTLDSLSNPALDLTVETQNFLAVSRRDVQARLSGSLRVRDRYVQPRVEGNLNVEQGVLLVEEFARTAEVVDLSDPALFEVTDTSLTTLRPALRRYMNPFLENLRLDVGVNLARGSWLRGRDLNVEMQGRLQVFWDRMKRDLAMVGELQAVRGIYTVFGRQFQVQEGNVSFLGTPGVNPNLDIRALNRLRTAEGETLVIIAQVGGTLLAPRVSLSSDAQFPISESDLVAYLIFGRPSYALASGQSRLARGAAGSLLGAATGAGVTLGLGALSSQIGSVFTRDVGLDYLAISQGEDAGAFGIEGLSGTVATTEVEVGQYLTDQIFAVLTWRPLTSVSGGTALDPFASFRVEWRLSDQWTLESFIEERFARASVFRSDLGYRQPKVLGFFLFRQWGY